MTVKELRDKLNSISEEEAENLTVVVTLNEPSIGATANAPLEGGFIGFDWDMGLFLLNSSKQICEKRNNAEMPPVRKNIRIINGTEIYRCPSCKIDIDGLDRFCKNCGQKFRD